jgi:hypothetical protein
MNAFLLCHVTLHDRSGGRAVQYVKRNMTVALRRTSRKVIRINRRFGMQLIHGRHGDRLDVACV